MEKKIFDLKRYGMVFCPRCYGQGYIEGPRLQCCPVCKGFGLIKTSVPADAHGPNASTDAHGPNASTEAWIPLDSLG